MREATLQSALEAIRKIRADMLTDVVSDVVRRNNIDLLDRLLTLRRLHGVAGNAIEEMEKATFESLK